jgi:hypothetical protein
VSRVHRGRRSICIEAIGILPNGSALLSHRRRSWWAPVAHAPTTLGCRPAVTSLESPLSRGSIAALHYRLSHPGGTELNTG